MSGKCRPSLRAKTLENVKRCNLSETDKDCIKAVFELAGKQQAEIERLKAEQQMAEGYTDALEERAKAEAVKEFAERLKEKASSCVASYNGVEIPETKTYQISGITLDNLAKEMVGEG